MITITHTRAEGTLVDGTSRGDGSNVPLKSAGFRWSRQLGCWYLPQSRDKGSKSWKIGRAVDALKAAGFEVTTEIDDSTTGRSFADAEAERYDRAERRADYHDQAAGSAAAKSDAGNYRARLEARSAEIADELEYWRKHVVAQEAAGVKVWSRADFTKGDFVRFLGSWYEVLRVSAKSVTIPAMINDGPVVRKEGARCTWTDTVPYHKVKGRKSAEDMAEILAEAERREQAATA